MVCKGICSRYKARKPYEEGRYELGQKRCSNYDIFLNWDGKYCPCCGIILRTKSKGTQTRQGAMFGNQESIVSAKFDYLFLKCDYRFIEFYC